MKIFEERRQEIAKKTLKMSDAILGVMGGMSKNEAAKIVPKEKK